MLFVHCPCALERVVQVHADVRVANVAVKIRAGDEAGWLMARATQDQASA